MLYSGQGMWRRWEIAMHWMFACISAIIGLPIQFMNDLPKWEGWIISALMGTAGWLLFAWIFHED